MSGAHLPLSEHEEHARLLAALRESEILRELGELLASCLDLDQILQVLVKRTTEVCEVERCAVWLLEDTRGVFRPATYHLSSQHLNTRNIEAAGGIWYRTPLPFDNPVIDRLLKENGMLFLEDLQVEPTLHRVAETFLVRSILLVALIREGRPVGMLSLDNPGYIRTFSPELQQLARAIGQQAAIAIDNARLYQQAQAERRRAEQLIERARAIYQVALTVNTSEDLSTVFKIALDHLVRGLEADGGAIVLVDADSLHLVSSSNLQQNAADMQITAALSDLPHCRHAAMTGTPLYITAEEVEGEEILCYRKLGLQNIMIVPLMTGKDRQETDSTALPPYGQCVGFAFVNFQQHQLHLSKGQFAFAQDIAAQCALAVEKARLLADMRLATTLATERANTLDAIFHAMTEGITVTDQNGEVLILNNAAAHFLGVPKNFKDHLLSFLRRYPTYTLHGQPITEEDFPLSRALRGERIRAERFATKRADGEERIVEMNIAPMFDSAERQIGVVSAFRDVTEQIRAEQRIRQALDTLLHVAEAVSGITDIKEILRAVLERTLVTLNCERGAVQLYDEEQRTFTPLLSIGFSPEAEKQWLNDQRIWLNPGPNNYHGFYNQLMEGHATLVNAEQCPHQPNPFSHIMILAAPIIYNNHLHGVILLDRSFPYRDDRESPAGEQRPPARSEFSVWDMAVMEGIAQLAGLAVEQAHWQQEAITARASEAAMREANTLKDEFLAITAHEFRTPLTVILAHSQMVLRTLQRAVEQNPATEYPPQFVESLTTIEEQARQLTNIVNTFLEVSQINRGKLVLKLEEVNLADIAQQVVTQHAATSMNHTITCIIEPSEQPYLVMGDSARLSQILANLVQNAIKYSPLGGPITVRLSRGTSSAEKAVIEVSVEDKGIGVPKDAQQRLFERFYRAPNTEGSKTRGVGLGLYVVAQLLYLHGGTIRVESSGILGEGSRFIFTLPALENR